MDITFHLPGRVTVILHIWRQHYDVLEEHFVDTVDGLNPLMERLREKYHDRSDVCVRSQYSIRHNQDCVMVFRHRKQIKHEKEA
jgi:hypothetical protein